MKWRVIPLSVNSASRNMSIDYAILEQVSKRESPPTLRLYRWKPSAVSIGYFQSVEEEVNLRECKNYGIDIVRRITGGGAVYHDYNGEITYSIIAPEKIPTIPSDILDSYRKICGGIVYAFKMLGLNAEFKPINDIVINGRKISGNAQTRRKGVILQHGTILVDLNVELMFKLLKITKEKISDKLIKRVKERVTSIKHELNSEVDFQKTQTLLIKGFSKVLSFEYEEGKLTPKEEELVIKYEKEKFSNPKWLFKR